MNRTKSPLAKTLMEKMGVDNLDSMWTRIPDQPALTEINARIGALLGQIEDGHRALCSNLERLASTQAVLQADLDRGAMGDSTWIIHHANSVAKAVADGDQALREIRPLMAIRSLMLGETPPTA